MARIMTKVVASGGILAQVGFCEVSLVTMDIRRALMVASDVGMVLAMMVAVLMGKHRQWNFHSFESDREQ
jgi:hypothetical protein